MMAQLLAHLWGDYLLQSDWMAQNKTKSTNAATVHAAFYTFCFFPLIVFGRHAHPMWLITVIFQTHFFIDRFRLARYVVWVKNFLGPGNQQWEACQPTGYPNERPAWLTVWLLIIADNTLHLTINYLALRYL